MKSLFLPLLLCIATIGVRSQNITVAEPEFSDETLLLTSDSTSIKLPRENASINTKASASMYLFEIGKIKSRVTLQGKESSAQVPHTPVIRLIVKAQDNNTDPHSFINIFKFDLKKSERRIQISETGTFSGSKKNSLAKIDYQAEKYGESSYLLTIQDLAEGEYGISLGDPNSLSGKNQLKITTFGITD